MPQTTSTLDDPKVVRAWTFYDWANSVFPLVINSAVFPASSTKQRMIAAEML